MLQSNLRSTEIQSPRVPVAPPLNMYVILIILLLSVTSTAPTTDLSVLQRLQKRAPMCYAASLALSVAPSLPDCFAAAKGMPVTQMPGTSGGAGASADVVGHFSNAAPDGSPFKLPRSFHVHSCMIGVSMVSPLPHDFEPSSWNEIYSNAVQVFRDCLFGHMPLLTGGTNKAGRADGVLIEVYGTYTRHHLPVGSLGLMGQGVAAGVQ